MSQATADPVRLLHHYANMQDTILVLLCSFEEVASPYTHMVREQAVLS
jgi:hypothetical protein